MSLITAAKHQLDCLIPRAARDEKSFREEAWLRMETMGLPGRRTETWKYSSLVALDKMDLPLQAGVSGNLPSAWTAWLEKIKKDFDTVVVVNGRYQAALSAPGNQVKIGTALLKSFTGEDGFSSLSAAVAEPGLRIEAPAGVKVKRPLLILKYQDNASSWISTFNEVVVGADAELRTVEILAGGKDKYLRTDLNALRLGENASLQWVRHQRESQEAYHFSETQVQMPALSRLHFTQVNRGARWLRGHLLVEITGAGAEAIVQGLTFLENDQHNDQRVVLSHRAGQTSSSQLFKGIFKDRSRGALNGKIFIAQDAQKVTSQQYNHNLLLSHGAEADTKPELEIYADDVKANHGATVGRLDEEKMFYLRSRGLTAAYAEQLLSEAFARDIYMKIPDLLLRKLAEVDYGP